MIAAKEKTQNQESLPTSLQDVDFMDVFISETGKVFFRGTDKQETLLPALSNAVLEQIDRLHRLVCSNERANDGEFFLDFSNIRFRVSRIDSVDETWYALRRSMWPIPRLPQLDGLHSRVIEYLGTIVRPGKSGLILVSGASSNGKTTTAYSILQECLMWYGNIAVTLEDPVELPMEGQHGNTGYCFQIPVRGGDFAGAIKKSMRHSPRYIFIGEIRGSDVASQVLRAAINGHIVISTIHAGNVIEAIYSILKFAAATESVELARAVLADGLLGVINQQLSDIQIKGTRRRHISAEYFFPGGDPGIKSLIRAGKIEQLTTAIEKQNNRIGMGLLPVEGG